MHLRSSASVDENRVGESKGSWMDGREECIAADGDREIVERVTTVVVCAVSFCLISYSAVRDECTTVSR